MAYPGGAWHPCQAIGLLALYYLALALALAPWHRREAGRQVHLPRSYRMRTRRPCRYPERQADRRVRLDLLMSLRSV